MVIGDDYALNIQNFLTNSFDSFYWQLFFPTKLLIFLHTCLMIKYFFIELTIRIELHDRVQISED